MRTSGLRNARDYNRGPAWPVRVVHSGWALIEPILGPGVAWVRDPSRRTWAVPLVLAAIVFPILYRLDPMIAGWARSIRLGGDVRREFEALQQYGQGLSTVLIATVIWLQDPKRRRRLADWGLAILVTGVVVNAGKLLVGRPRPKYDDPTFFLGPLGQYPVDRVVNGRPVGIRHSWEIWSGISSDLWSMPSSHTAYVVIMAVVIGTMYPRLRVLVAAIAVLVGLGRILTGAHYATDVLVGAAIGLAVTWTIMARAGGQRLLDRITAGRSGGKVRSSAPPRSVSAVRTPGAELLPTGDERD